MVNYTKFYIFPLNNNCRTYRPKYRKSYLFTILSVERGATKFLIFKLFSEEGITKPISSYLKLPLLIPDDEYCI